MMQVRTRTRNVAFLVFFLFLFSTNTNSVSAATQFTTGQITTDHTWKQVRLPSKFRSPVIIIAPPTYNGSEPGVVQIQKIHRKGFQLRFKEWRYLDGRHPAETFSYLVLERGRHRMSDGSIWEVGTFSLNNTGKWKSRRFTKSFPGTPTLLLTSQSSNNRDPVTVHARHVTKRGFQVALYEEERRQNGHPSERIGYVAIYSKRSNGNLKVQNVRYSYQRGGLTLTHRFAQVRGTSVKLKLEEEQSRDREISHGKERLAFLTLQGRVFAQPISQNNRDTFALRQQARRPTPSSRPQIVLGTIQTNHVWKRIRLPSGFKKPVVIVTPPSYNEDDPGVVQLQKITRQGFQLRFKEWRYLDGGHRAETFSYLVLDQGRHRMSDGSIWEVGTLSLNGTARWKTYRFSKGFPETPTLLLTSQTANNRDPITVHARRVTKSGFQVALYEEERRQNGHPSEQIGYVAIYNKKSSGSLEIQNTRYTYQRRGLTLTHRFAPVRGANAKLKLEEEQSRDRETSHSKESLALLMLQGRVFAQPISQNNRDTFALRLRYGRRGGDIQVATTQPTSTKSTGNSSKGSSSSGNTNPNGNGSTPSKGSTTGGSTSPTQTVSLTLSWAPNTEPDLHQYKVYQKASPGEPFGSPIATLDKHTTSFTMTGLPQNQTYYFGVTALDDSGNESNFSEISKSIY